jgi:hypothetical protein
VTLVDQRDQANTPSPPDSPTPHAREVNLPAEPTEAEYTLSSNIRELFYRARAARRPIVAQWQKNYRLITNKTWTQGRPAWMPSPEVPEIYPIVTSMVGWMTDQRPILECAPSVTAGVPAYDFLSSTADDLATAINSTWQVNQFENEIEKTVWDGWTYGTGFFKTIWDNTLDNGLGNARLIHVDPFTVYPDPQSTSPKDWNYVVEARTMSLQEMDRRWPGSAELFGNGGQTEDVDVAPTRTDTATFGMPKANPGAISPATAPRYGLPGQGRVTANNSLLSDPGVTVFECWIREHTTEESDDTSRPDDVTVHDGWRVVVVAGNRVLMDEKAEDIWSHGRHPYSRFVVHDTGEFWGTSMVELLAPSQLAVNRLLASLQANIELVGSPPLKESQGAQIQRTKVTNRPGQRITMRNTNDAEWMQPPTLSPVMMQLIQYYVGRMEAVSGLSAISRGSTPTSRNSEGVLDSVQEASFVRVRMALRNLEYALRDQGNLMASLIVEFYDEPRIVSVVGPTGEASTRTLKAKHFYIPLTDDEDPVPLKYTLLINAGSMLPVSSEARRQDAMMLGGMGFLDQTAVLEAFHWPHVKEVVQRTMAIAESGLMNQATQKSARGAGSA